MKKIKLWTKLIALTVVAALAFTACGTTEKENAASSKKESSKTASTEAGSADAPGDEVGEFTIRVGVNSGDQNQYLKILDNHTDFLKDRGINLEVTEFAAGINTIDAITTGQLDVGLFADYAGVNRIGNTLNDTRLRAFALMGITNAYRLYVNPDTVSTPEDLVGKTVISQAGVVFEYDYGKLFETYSIAPDSVTFANVSSTQEALALAATGDGDSYWVNANSYDLFEEQGWVPLLTLDEVDATMYTYLVADEAYLTEHQAEVSKFLKISDEAFSYITEHLDEFAGWVAEETGFDKDRFIATWKTSTHEYGFPQEAYEDLAKVEKWCYENGNFDTDYDVADFINTDALEAVFPERVNWSAE